MVVRESASQSGREQGRNGTLARAVGGSVVETKKPLDSDEALR